MVRKNDPATLPLEHQKILLYGEPKIGKSTLTSQFNNPLFIEVESGLRNIKCDKIKCPSWAHFKAISQEVAANGAEGYNTIVIDTVPRLWELCRTHVQKKLGIEHESDLGYGKGWSTVTDEFKPYFYALTGIDNVGFVGIAHSYQEEITTPSKTYMKYKVDVPNGCRKIVLPEMEIIMFARKVTDAGETRRVLTCESSEYWEAGDRTGRLLGDIDMSYEALSKAYGG